MKTIETKELNVIKQQSSKAFNVAQGLTIKNSEDLDVAKDVLDKVAKAQKIVKNKKEAITKPLMAGLKEVRELFKPIEQTLTEAEYMVKDKMLDYSAMLKKKEVKAEKEIELKINNGELGIDKAGEKLEKIESKREEIPTMKVQEVVIDIDELYRAFVEEFLNRKLTAHELVNTKRPENPYLIPDRIKLNADVKAGKEVPGAKLSYREVIKK